MSDAGIISVVDKVVFKDHAVVATRGFVGDRRDVRTLMFTFIILKVKMPSIKLGRINTKDVLYACDRATILETFSSVLFPSLQSGKVGNGDLPFDACFTI